MNELQKSDAVSVCRRDFCKKAIKRTSIAVAVGVAGYLAYRKPRSFTLNLTDSLRYSKIL